MTKQILTVVNVTGIQPYIFGSNKLRENIGASELVEQATTDWVCQTLYDQGQSNISLNAAGRYERIDSFQLKRDALGAELLYAGGGNAAILFRDKPLARRWATAFSRKLLLDAPGLNTVIVHSEAFDWDPTGNDLASRLDDLLERQTAIAKQTTAPSAPLIGLGVTATCQSTGFAAIADYQETPQARPQRISREIQAKLNENVQNAADVRLQLILPSYFHGLGLRVPRDFDDLGRSAGEQSYIAVVHADGNGIGQRFRDLRYITTNNQDYIASLRQLSDGVRKVGYLALQQTLDRLLGTLTNPTGALKPLFDTLKHLPFRALVYGGDDVTFVCDGRLGLALAAAYLKAFEAVSELIPGGKATACAGVAIVKTHYPFAQAYALSEQLAAQAKRWRRAEPSDDSVLDWHIAMSGILADLDTIRTREYRVSEGRLTLRPLPLSGVAGNWRTWEQFSETIKQFQAEWSESRNKVMALRDALRAGAQQTKQFLTLFGLPDLPGYVSAPQSLRETGWVADKHSTSDKQGQICGYFDAIEAMEFWVALQ